MRLKFEISELALSDLESIWNNTAINWSSKQANKYYDEIIAQIDIICDNPRIGRSIAHVKPISCIRIFGKCFSAM